MYGSKLWVSRCLHNDLTTAQTALASKPGAKTAFRRRHSPEFAQYRAAKVACANDSILHAADADAAAYRRQRACPSPPPPKRHDRKTCRCGTCRVVQFDFGVEDEGAPERVGELVARTPAQRMRVKVWPDDVIQDVVWALVEFFPVEYVAKVFNYVMYGGGEQQGQMARLDEVFTKLNVDPVPVDEHGDVEMSG